MSLSRLLFMLVALGPLTVAADLAEAEDEDHSSVEPAVLESENERLRTELERLYELMETDSEAVDEPISSQTPTPATAEPSELTMTEAAGHESYSSADLLWHGGLIALLGVVLGAILARIPSTRRRRGLDI